MHYNQNFLVQQLGDTFLHNMDTVKAVSDALDALREYNSHFLPDDQLIESHPNPVVRSIHFDVSRCRQQIVSRASVSLRHHSMLLEDAQKLLDDSSKIESLRHERSLLEKEIHTLQHHLQSLKKKFDMKEYENIAKQQADAETQANLHPLDDLIPKEMAPPPLPVPAPVSEQQVTVSATDLIAVVQSTLPPPPTITVDSIPLPTEPAPPVVLTTKEGPIPEHSIPYYHVHVPNPKGAFQEVARKYKWTFYYNNRPLRIPNAHHVVCLTVEGTLRIIVNTCPKVVSGEHCAAYEALRLLNKMSEAHFIDSEREKMKSKISGPSKFPRKGTMPLIPWIAPLDRRAPYIDLIPRLLDDMPLRTFTQQMDDRPRLMVRRRPNAPLEDLGPLTFMGREVRIRDLDEPLPEVTFDNIDDMPVFVNPSTNTMWYPTLREPIWDPVRNDWVPDQPQWKDGSMKISNTPLPGHHCEELNTEPFVVKSDAFEVKSASLHHSTPADYPLPPSTPEEEDYLFAKENHHTKAHRDHTHDRSKLLQAQEREYERLSKHFPQFKTFRTLELHAQYLHQLFVDQGYTTRTLKKIPISVVRNQLDAWSKGFGIINAHKIVRSLKRSLRHTGEATFAHPLDSQPAPDVLIRALVKEYYCTSKHSVLSMSQQNNMNSLKKFIQQMYTPPTREETKRKKRIQKEIESDYETPGPADESEEEGPPSNFDDAVNKHLDPLAKKLGTSAAKGALSYIKDQVLSTMTSIWSKITNFGKGICSFIVDNVVYIVIIAFCCWMFGGLTMAACQFFISYFPLNKEDVTPSDGAIQQGEGDEEDESADKKFFILNWLTLITKRLTKRSFPISSNEIFDGWKSFSAFTVSFKNIKEFVSTSWVVFRKLLNWVAQKLTGVPFFNQERLSQELMRDYQDLDDLDKSLDPTIFQKDMDQARLFIERFNTLNTRAKTLLKYCDKNDEIKISKILGSALPKVQAAYAVLQTEHDRTPPVLCNLQGPPKTGKSALMKALRKMCYSGLKHFGYVKAPFADNCVYERKLEVNGFWSNYNRQPIVTYDDLLQSKDVQDRKQQALEIIYAVNSAAFPVSMPDLASKGLTFFESLLIFSTSNDKVTQAQDLGIQDPKAFYRRITINVDVELKQEVHGVTIPTVDNLKNYDLTVTWNGMQAKMDPVELSRLIVIVYHLNHTAHKDGIVGSEEYDKILLQGIPDSPPDPPVSPPVSLPLVDNSLKTSKTTDPDFQEQPSPITVVIPLDDKPKSLVDLFASVFAKFTNIVLVPKDSEKPSSSQKDPNLPWDLDLRQTSNLFKSIMAHHDADEVTTTLLHLQLPQDCKAPFSNDWRYEPHPSIPFGTITSYHDPLKPIKDKTFVTFFGWKHPECKYFAMPYSTFEHEEDVWRYYYTLFYFRADAAELASLAKRQWQRIHNVTRFLYYSAAATAVVGVVGLMATLAVHVVKAMGFTGARPKFLQESLDPRTQKKENRLRRKFMKTQKPLQSFVQQMEDLQAADIANSIATKNLRYCAFIHNDGATTYSYVLMIKGHTGAAANHEFLCHGGLREIRMFYNPSDPDSYHASRIYHGKDQKLHLKQWPEKDLAMFTLLANKPHTDITHHFMTEEDYREGKFSKPARLSFNDHGAVCLTFGTVAVTNYKYNSISPADGSSSVMSGCLEVKDCEGDAGECTAPYMLFDTSHVRKILGLHSGADRESCVAAPLTQEMIAEFFKEFPPSTYAKFSEAPMSDLKDFLQQHGYAFTPKAGFFHEGMTQIGFLDKPLRSATNSEFESTIVLKGFTSDSGQYYAPPYDSYELPSKLRPGYTKEGEYRDPKMLSFRKFKGKKIPAIEMHYFDPTPQIWPATLVSDNVLRPLSDQEAIEGCDACRVKPINMKSSAGCFYSSTGYTRRDLFRKTDIDKGDEFWILPQLVDRVRYIENCARNRLIPHIFSKSELKSELRPKDRVDLFYTRFFNNLEPAHLVHARKYVAPILSVIERYNTIGCTIGYNPFGRDWTRLFTDLTKYGEHNNNISGADTEAYDINQMPEIAIAFCEDCIAAGIFERDSDWHHQVYVSVLTSLHCHVIIHDRVVICEIMVSGALETSGINTYSNEKKHVYLFKIASSEQGGLRLDFYAYNVGRFHGDDSLIAIQPEILHWWNELTIAKYAKQYVGHTHTDPDKGTLYAQGHNIFKVVFLQRRFRKELGRIAAPLNPISMISSVQWIKKNKQICHSDMLKINLDNALVEWSYHGKIIYEQQLAKLTPFYIHIRRPLPTQSWDDMMDVFIANTS